MRVIAQGQGPTPLLGADFVPVEVDGRAPTVLVTGPFSTARPTRADLLSRWRWLTGRAGHASDPAFSRYVGVTLDATVNHTPFLAKPRMQQA